MNKTMVFLLGCLPLFWGRVLGFAGLDVHSPVYEWIGFLSTAVAWVFLTRLAVEKLKDKKQAVLWLNVPSLTMAMASLVAILWVDADLSLANEFFAAVHGPLHLFIANCGRANIVSALLLLLISIVTSKFLKTNE